MIKCRIFLLVTAFEIFALTAFCIHGAVQSSAAGFRLQNNRDIARQLALTDLAIWTEARYTRNPSQTDFASPFQDFPGSPDHFPAGSVIAPPVFSNKTSMGGGI